MEIKEFINNFQEQFENSEELNLTPETNFREITTWDSLTGLMTISMADEIYGVILTPEELKSATTVKDLYNIILSKYE